MRIVVVGAGIAGLVCARALVAQGHEVRVLDKGRVPGGRTCSRAHGFDHGAQFFTARGAWLAREVRTWERTGVVAPWTPRGRRERADTWWVGTPAMGALARHLADGLDVRTDQRVTELVHDGAWSLAIDGGASERADGLIVAIPAAQCAALLAPVSLLGRTAAAVVQTPCWAVMVTTRGGRDDVDVIEDPTGPIAWAARERSKPGRAAPESGERWTLHASTAWSEAHVEDHPAQVAAELAGVFVATIGATLDTAHAHRWRYARGEQPTTPPAWSEPATRLVVCGDWLAHARVEGAVQSGLAAARLI